MNDTIPLRTRRLTAEEILASLTDAYALNANFNDNSPYLTNAVHAEMTVEEYCDDMEVYDAREFLNHWFDLSLSREESWAVGTPTRQQTLRELCEFYATRAEARAIDPVTVLGRPCLSAGAFLSVRTMLAEAGADVSRLAPSSPLGPYLRKHFMIFARDISKLSPGTFPRIEEDERPTISVPYLGTGAVILAGLLALVMVLDRQFLNCCSPLLAIAFIPAILVLWLRARALRQTAELPGVYDFRDLVDKLLNRPLRRTANPEMPT